MRKKNRWTLEDIRPPHRKCHRWKIVDANKAKELGITNIIPGRGGIIQVSLEDIPDGMSILDVLGNAELAGVLIIHHHKPKR